jgi:hypothetical protein
MANVPPRAPISHACRADLVLGRLKDRHKDRKMGIAAMPAGWYAYCV